MRWIGIGEDFNNGFLGCFIHLRYKIVVLLAVNLQPL